MASTTIGVHPDYAENYARIPFDLKMEATTYEGTLWLKLVASSGESTHEFTLFGEDGDTARFRRAAAAFNAALAEQEQDDPEGRALNFIENTESELGVTLESGDAVRAALRKTWGEQ